jgi:hypothetical protein
VDVAAYGLLWTMVWCPLGFLALLVAALLPPSYGDMGTDGKSSTMPVSQQLQASLSVSQTTFLFSNPFLALSGLHSHCPP